MTDVRRYIGPISRRELSEILHVEANAHRALEQNASIEYDREENALLEALIERKIVLASLRIADKFDP
jgi:hypothetical protein